MLTSFFATSNNGNNSGVVVGNKLTDSCSLLNESTLKFMCDVCGNQMENLSSLKSHLSNHQHQSEHRSSCDIKSNNSFSSLSNSKLSSIIATAKNVSTLEANSKKNPFVINIPQTMKVFSVKDILTKLKNHSPNTNPSTTTMANISNVPDSNQVLVNDTKSEENNNNHNNNNEHVKFVSNANDHSATTSIVQLEDLDKLVQINAASSCSSIGVGGTSNNCSTEQTPYHYSECENVYICNMCNCTYDSLRSIKAHLWKHSGHHKFSYPIHDYNNRTESTGKPITMLTKPLANNTTSLASKPIKSPKTIQSETHSNEIQFCSKNEKHNSLNVSTFTSNRLDMVVTNENKKIDGEYDECDENLNQRPRKKQKSIKAKSSNLISATSSTNQFSSPTSSLSPASTSPSNSNRPNDGNQSGNVSCSSSSGGGGGICSVLLEVIEKLRDAESSSSLISMPTQIIDVSNKVTDLKNSKKSYKLKNVSNELKKRKKKPSQLINTILNNVNRNESVGDDDDEADELIAATQSEQEQQINGVKKQRKKRISKKLNQLIAMNCGNMSNSFTPIDSGVKEMKSNKIAMIIESQQKYFQIQPNENNNGINESYTDFPLIIIPEETVSTTSKTQTYIANSDSLNEECTIETSIVNSLYDDGVSILSNLDSNVDGQVDEKEKSGTYNLNNAKNGDNNIKSEDDVDFNFSYKNHNGVLLNDLNIKLIENSDDKEESSKRSFLCFKCSLFFNDLLALCEHKSNCEKSFDQLVAPNLTSDTSNYDSNSKIKYYLCDLCHSKDPLNTVMSESNRAKPNNYSKTINSYYLLNISDKKFYFKCFGDLDAINEHFKTEHQQHLSSNTSYSKICEGKTETNLKQEQSTLTSSVENETQLKNTSQDMNNQNYSIISTSQCIEIKNLLESLATNDGGEQYVCGLCNYVCYHLPSLKSHMWTHVKHEKFDYSINTSIINAALDYENKLNRNMSSINLSIKNDLQTFLEQQQSQETSDAKNTSGRMFLEKKLANILEMINYSETKKKLTHLLTSSNKPMVLFRCSKCRFETIDLCLLRLHKQEHYTK